MTAIRISMLTLLQCGLLAATPQAWAHHGPTKAIEDLSDRIAHEGPSAELYTRRGDEFRSLGEDDHAAEDYAAALALDGDWLPALYGVAHVQINCGQLRDAAKAAERGIETSPDDDAAAPFHALLARIHERGDQWDDALKSWDCALGSSRPEVDWFLGKAEALWKLKRADAAEESLRSAMQRNPSVVLKRAWHESLVRSRRYDEAQAEIEAGLDGAKWKSSWLLLRARLHAAQGRRVAARQDALAALDEIDGRLRPDAPNPFLAADKARALAMLGRDEEAEQQAKIARSMGVPAWKLQGFEGTQTPTE